MNKNNRVKRRTEKEKKSRLKDRWSDHWKEKWNDMFQRNQRNKRDRSTRLIDDNAPFSYVEAYKSLRTNIDFLSSTNNYHSIMITSASSWDGKSTVAINLSIAMADINKKVVLVDCDMRKGSIATYFKINRNSSGITDVLSGKRKLSEVMHHNKKFHIDILTVGALPSNPAELIGSAEMINLLQSLSDQYDYIFIDTPPVSLVTDAAILSRFVDGVFLVVRADETTKQALNLSKKNLEDVNAHILGVVLNSYKTNKYSHNAEYGYSYEE